MLRVLTLNVWDLSGDWRSRRGASSVDLPHVVDPLDIQRVVLHARTGGVEVFSTHLAWQLHDAALRERQVRALMTFVRERAAPDALAVVAGDFNAEPAPALSRRRGRAAHT